MDNADRTDTRPVEYEPPTVTDYGSLAELTQAGHNLNSDVEAGTPNTAFSART